MILTLIFVVLLSGAIFEKQGLFKTVIYTGLGVVVIWAVYFIRARIFSKMS